MAEETKKKSFWEIFTIVVGAITAVLGGLSGVAALITALKDPPKTEAAPTAQAAPAKTPPPAVDDAAQRAAAEEIKRAKAEAEAAKAELARIKARAEEEQATVQTTEQKPGDLMKDSTTDMEFVYVPGGCFSMGSPPDEKDRRPDESPAHKVCVDGFWMGKYEVTQGQWQKIKDNNPSRFKNDASSRYPVESVSWNNAQNFIKKLNSKTDKSYRLPTEAEWEYACRGNSSGKNQYCGSNELDVVAWYGGNSGGTQEVGEKQENAFGLHDMSGNVLEWCNDWYQISYYSSSPEKNPQGPLQGQHKVLRGGSWISYPMDCRAAYRYHDLPDEIYEHIGFRLVLSSK